MHVCLCVCVCACIKFRENYFLFISFVCANNSILLAKLAIFLCNFKAKISFNFSQFCCQEFLMSDIISCFTAHFYLLQRMRAIFTANFGCVHLNEFCKSCSKQQQQQQQAQRVKRKEGKRSTRVKKLVSLSSEHPETVLSPLSSLCLLSLSPSNNVKEICSQLC